MLSTSAGVTEMFLAFLSFGLFFFFAGSAPAQPVTADEIIARLAQDGYSRGGSQAPLTLIEFSDFRCSFCRKFWQDTLPTIDKKYIKTGKLRFIYRHLAILGAPSMAAAQAAECAGAQGKFWEYHDKLFSRAGSPMAFSDASLKSYAKELKLKSGDFNQCLDSGKFRSKVEGESGVAAYLGIRGTPAFLINGQLLVGAQPFEVFESVFERELKKASQSKKPKP
jgi:protein-disulfide isomerase